MSLIILILHTNMQKPSAAYQKTQIKKEKNNPDVPKDLSCCRIGLILHFIQLLRYTIPNEHKMQHKPRISAAPFQSNHNYPIIRCSSCHIQSLLSVITACKINIT